MRNPGVVLCEGLETNDSIDLDSTTEALSRLEIWIGNGKHVGGNSTYCRSVLGIYQKFGTKSEHVLEIPDTIRTNMMASTKMHSCSLAC